MIRITDRAVEKVKEIAEAEGIDVPSIRLKVVGGGCAGFSYDMTFDDVVSELDEELVINGVKVITDPLSMQYLEEVEIDFVDSPFGAGFKFINPNVKSTCGCGSSFSA